MFILHFYPSVLVVGNTNKYILKTGAPLTISLAKYSFENEDFKEIKSFQRFAGS